MKHPQNPWETPQETPGNTLPALFPRCVFFRTPGNAQRETVRAGLVLGLTAGQNLVFAIVGLVFVVWLLLAPFLEDFNHRPRDPDKAESHRRLMREIRHHRDR